MNAEPIVQLILGLLVVNGTITREEAFRLSDLARDTFRGQQLPTNILWTLQELERREA